MGLNFKKFLPPKNVLKRVKNSTIFWVPRVKNTCIFSTNLPEIKVLNFKIFPAKKNRKKG